MNAKLLSSRAVGAISACVALSSAALLAPAQPTGTSPLAPPTNGPRHGDSTWNAFTGATVHVSPEKTLEHATVVVRDGHIVSVGDGAPPAGARVWDCSSLHIYPGFIDAFVEVDAPEPDRNAPGVHWNTRVTPQRSALDGNGLDDKTAESLRKLGFAAAAISPRGGVFRGSSAVVSLAKPAAESSAERPPVYRKDAYQSVAFELERRRRGEGGQRAAPDGPDNQRWSSYPDSEMGAIALIRQTLIDADWQADARKAGATIPPNALDPLVSRGVPAPGGKKQASGSAIPEKGATWDFSGNAPYVLSGPGGAKMPGSEPVPQPEWAHDLMPINRVEGNADKVPIGVDRNAPAARAASADEQYITLTHWESNKPAIKNSAVLEASESGESASEAPDAAGASRAGPLLVFDTEDELEALRAAKIAREFNRDAAIVGSGTEFRRLDAIKADGLPIVLPLRYPKTPDVSTVGKADAVELRELMTWEEAPTNPRRLDAAGLKVALTTAKLKNRSEFSENLQQALKCGLTPNHALAMLTTQPAEILGVSDRLGTIEPGKEANLIIADGDLFEAWPQKKSDAGAEKHNDLDAAKGDEPKGDEAKGDEGEHGGAKSDARGADKPDRKKSKIREVWIDGVRHELSPPPAKDVFGTWAITEIDGQATDPQAPDAVTFTVTPEGAVTYRRSGQSEKASNVKVTEGRLEYTIDGKKLFNIPAVLTDSGVVDEPDVMHGITPMPSGKLHRWTAKRTSPDVAPDKNEPRASARGQRTQTDEKPVDKPVVIEQPKTQEERNARIVELIDRARDLQTKGDDKGCRAAVNELLAIDPKNPTGLLLTDLLDGTLSIRRFGGPPHEDAKREPSKNPEQEERDAIAAIPDELGYPFGPYMLDEFPKQGWLIITGATIWTSGPAGIIKNGEIDIHNGKITYVGAVQTGLIPDARATRIDATGKQISPGIIDCHSHTGISKGVNESGEAVTAQVRIEDVTDPDAISWYRQLAAGVTCVNNLHGSANAIGGQNCINKVRWGVKHPDEMHMAGAMPGIKFALGENPKQSNWGDRMTTRYPQTRMGVEMLIRDRFTAAKEYMATLKAAGLHADYTLMSHDEVAQANVDAVWSRGGVPGPDGGVQVAGMEPIGLNTRAFPEFINQHPAPRRDLQLEALAQILEGKRLVHCHSYRQDELLMLCRVADDFGFKIGTFQHVLEGYKVADEIARHARGGSCFADWWAYKVEVQDAIPENGPIMAGQGVVVSYNSDSDELARRLNTEAAKAEKYGALKPEEALKFVTINPAKQLAIDEHVGSLEVGKDADLVIWSGSPLSEFSRPEATYVDGRCLFSLEQDKAARETIQKERSRLTQKALAAAKRSKPGEGGRPDGPGLGGPWQRPTDDDRAIDVAGSDATSMPDGAGRHQGMLERYYLDLLNRGGDPTAARPGECGCGAR